jgi:hypothetical protein
VAIGAPSRRRDAGEIPAAMPDSPSPLPRARRATRAFTPRRCTQVAVPFSVPEGRVIVAQQFTAGKIGSQGRIASPGGTVENVLSRLVSNRPYGTITFFLPNPAMNRWAIVKRPYGAKYSPLVCNNEGPGRGNRGP